MGKMKITAKRLDIFFRITQTFITIALVASIVGLGIIGAYFLFDLSADVIGTGYGSVDVGFLELEIAESACLSRDVIILGAAAELALGLLCLLAGRGCVNCVRSILAPMAEGAPFRDTVSRNLSKLGRLTCALGIKLNLMEIIAAALMAQAYDLPNLLLSENIVRVTMQYEFDLGFVLVAAVFALLSLVFRYGEGLQQLSDETL